MIHASIKEQINLLKREYDQHKPHKEALLKLLEETELPEQVYNSNAIENSTLTLKETERILLEQQVMRNVSVRELFEAQNLARVIGYLDKHPNMNITLENIKLLHQMLLGGIDDEYAGRYREAGEYVRVGRHIAPPPEHVEGLLQELILDYQNSQEVYFVESIAEFHLRFESIHPFNDGNGRLGRVILNHQCASLGYPPFIIRSKGRERSYYPLFSAYNDDRKTEGMTLLLSRAVRESLHKRLAYLKGFKIIKLTDYARRTGQQANVVLNQANRQTIAAFRERGVWCMGEEIKTQPSAKDVEKIQ